MFILSIFNLDSFNARLGAALTSRSCLISAASSGEPKIWQRGGGTGVWGCSPQPLTNFYGFHIKNTHFSKLFYQKKGHAVSAVAMDNAKIFSQIMSKSRSLAKISEKRLQSLLV